jgi:hypothetical protein
MKPAPIPIRSHAKKSPSRMPNPRPTTFHLRESVRVELHLEAALRLLGRVGREALASEDEPPHPVRSSDLPSAG